MKFTKIFLLISWLSVIMDFFGGGRGGSALPKVSTVNINYLRDTKVLLVKSKRCSVFLREKICHINYVQHMFWKPGNDHTPSINTYSHHQ